MPPSARTQSDHLPAQLNACCLGWWEALHSGEQRQTKLFPMIISSFSKHWFGTYLFFSFPWTYFSVLIFLSAQHKVSVLELVILMLRQEGNGALSWSSASSPWQPLLEVFPSGTASEWHRLQVWNTTAFSNNKWLSLSEGQLCTRQERTGTCLLHSNLQGPGQQQAGLSLRQHRSLCAHSHLSVTNVSPAGWLCISRFFRAHLSKPSSCTTENGVSVLSIQVSIGHSHGQCLLRFWNKQGMCVCMCMNVCIYVCMYMCVYSNACLYIYRYLCVHAHMLLRNAVVFQTCRICHSEAVPEGNTSKERLSWGSSRAPRKCSVSFLHTCVCAFINTCVYIYMCVCI